MSVLVTLASPALVTALVRHTASTGRPLPGTPSLHIASSRSGTSPARQGRRWARGRESERGARPPLQTQHRTYRERLPSPHKEHSTHQRVCELCASVAAAVLQWPSQAQEGWSVPALFHASTPALPPPHRLRPTLYWNMRKASDASSSPSEQPAPPSPVPGV